ncbi:MAG: phosphoglycerate dehydrogenase [Pseudomonadota bacterium]
MMKTSLNKNQIKILLLENIHPNAEETLQTQGYSNVTQLAHAPPEDELKAMIPEYHLIGIRSRTQITADVLAEANRLVALGCFCIGTNQVDLDSAAQLGIPVFNAPFSNTRSVAELVLAEAILLLRGVPEKSMRMHAGTWTKSAEGAHEIRGKTLGIIGYGNIGGQLSVMAENLGMRVIYYDVEPKLRLGNADPVADLNQLLTTSDIVTLHVPDTPSTRNLIGTAELAAMQAHAVLINASRGGVVDIGALAAALAEKRIGGAAIDVFPQEPKSNAEPFESPLLNAHNTLLTPHIGGSTIEAQANIGIEVAEKLIRFSDNGSTQSAVNFPEVSLPEHVNLHRLLHIHHDVPGVMSEVNATLSSAGINIAGQYLMTRNKIGYVVIDINREYSQDLLTRLKAIKGTLKCRVLF